MALGPAVIDELQERVLRGGTVRPVVALGEQRSDFLCRQAEVKELEQRPGIFGRRPAFQRRVEVGDQNVVGLDRLETAGLELPAIVGLEHQ